MLRMIFGGFDASQSLRLKWYELGLKDLRLVWLFGYFMGDVNTNSKGIMQCTWEKIPPKGFIA